MRAAPRSAGELRAFVAMGMASAALSIDLILPSFSRIERTFGLPEDSSSVTRLITFFFLGMAVGQMPFGVLSDRFGRKPVLWAACVVYVLGSALAASSQSLGLMVSGRFLWGFGAAGLRVATIAIVRDRFAGSRMAKEMSFIMTVFIIVPILAPSLGAAIIAVLPWRSVFVVCILFGFLLATWALRIPETLPPERRRTLGLTDMAAAGRLIVTNRQTLGCTLGMTAIFAAFSSYLASSELIVRDVFDRKDQFPFIFGAIAIVMGMATLLNGRLVDRVGMERLIRVDLVVFSILTLTLLAISQASDGRPGFWPFTIVLAVTLASYGQLFPNLNAAAMSPMGEMAGTASAVIGTVSVAAGALVGSLVDSAFDETVGPITMSFFGCSLVALAVSYWALGGIHPDRSIGDRDEPFPGEPIATEGVR